MATPIPKRNYKDSLFNHLFGSEERKQNALELYNALAGTSHRDPGELELTTIDDAVFLGRKNDVSFLVGDEMVMVEHQSTHCPNMPLRGLQYFSRLYGKLVTQRGLDLYGRRRLELPTPRYVALYFGPEERPEREVMRLSDSFPAGPGDLEVTVTVLNCNEGSNGAIMDVCEALRGYAHLVALARANERSGMPARAAVVAAVERCIDEGMLADYLTAHRAEVEEMLFTIQDEERAMRVHWEAVDREIREKVREASEKASKEASEKAREKALKEGREEGLREGREEGLRIAQAESVRNLMANMGLSAEQARAALGIPAGEP